MEEIFTLDNVYDRDTFSFQVNVLNCIFWKL